jgi:hypothetical protein
MTRALRPPTRALLGAMSVAALMALYSGCSSTDVNTNRQGGPLPAVPEGGAEASLSDVPVPWCAAYRVINCVCQQCHQNPPLNGAPIPLMTYDDTQAPFPVATSKGRVWQTMQTVVSTRFMPYMGDKTVMPVVLPLSDADYDTLLSWLGQGATDLGGQDCPMECDWSKGPPPGR